MKTIEWWIMNPNYMNPKTIFAGCFILFLSITMVKAQEGTFPIFNIDYASEEYDLTNSISYIEDQEEDNIREDFASYLDRFADYSPDINLDPEKAYWAGCRLFLDSGLQMKIENWYLFVGECDYFEVVQLNSNLEIIERIKGGSLVPEKEKVLQHGNHIRRVKFNLEPGQENYLFVRYARVNNQHLKFDVRLSKFDFYQSWEYLLSSRRDWFFLGFIFTMFLFNLMYFILTKRDAFLYHGLFILGVFVFTLDFFGVTPDLWWIRDHPKFIQLIDYLSLALIDICYFQFVRKYLELKENDAVWDKRFGWIVRMKVIFFISIILFHYLTFNEPLADQVMAIFLASGFLFTIIFISFLYQKKSINRRFVLTGTTIIFLAILLNAYSILRGQGLWTLFTEIGIGLEIILFSVALAYRLKQLREEEHKAKTILEIDALKNKFFTNITHEFRTPLTIINGVAEVAKEKIKSLDTAGLHDSFRKIKNQSDKLLHLVNQVLGLTKIESKSLKLKIHDIDLIPWLDDIVTDFSEYALQKGLDLIFSTTEEQIKIHVDDQQLKTVISNLISNAIKFTEPGGRIDVYCYPENQESSEGVVIKVIDTGIGISKEDLPKIFDRYYRVEDHNIPGVHGIGVGLSMCQEIIELLNGRISAESELKKGTTFMVWVPVKADYPGVEVGKYDNKKLEEAIYSDIFPTSHDEMPIALVIDDNADILDLLNDMIKDKFTVVKASDGQEGFKMAIEHVPDIIIADIMMPVMDGYELCKKLKSDKNTDHIPVILLTAKTAESDRMEGWKKGADAYITKPFEKKELVLVIDNLYTLRKTLQEKYSHFTFVEDKEKLKKESSFIHSVHEILNENLSNAEFSVEELANKMFMSRMQLHRKIKALSDKSASHYIRSFRLHKAKLHLKDLNASIGDVAYDVGFQSPNYFSRSFHQEFGITPSEYRETML